MEKDCERVAREFIEGWEAAWNGGHIEQVMSTYADDSVLVGYITAVGKANIEAFLRGLLSEGWNRVEIRITNVREINGLILIGNEYTAFGSGANAGRRIDAKSSHVLSLVDGAYVSVLHTAP